MTRKVDEEALSWGLDLGNQGLSITGVAEWLYCTKEETTQEY